MNLKKLSYDDVELIIECIKHSISVLKPLSFVSEVKERIDKAEMLKSKIELRYEEDKGA